MFSILNKVLTNEFLDINFSTSDEFDVTVMERPGCWFEKDRLELLRNDLLAIASKTLDRGSLTYGVFKADGSGLNNAVVTLIREKATGKPVAFNALVVMDVALGQEKIPVLHLGLVMVDPQLRSKGISWMLYGLTCILFLVRNQFRPIWISNVTQVPAIVGMVTESFSKVYPQPNVNWQPSIKTLLMAREIMANHRHVFGVGNDAEFDEQFFVIKNAYTGGSDDLKKTFAMAQKHRDEIYNHFCSQKLDYDRGDDFLQLGQFDISATKNYLLKSVPPRSILAVAAFASFAVLQKIALPVVHWLDTSRSWGNLRARGK